MRVKITLASIETGDRNYITTKIKEIIHIELN